MIGQLIRSKINWLSIVGLSVVVAGCNKPLEEEKKVCADETTSETCGGAASSCEWNAGICVNKPHDPQCSHLTDDACRASNLCSLDKRGEHPCQSIEQFQVRTCYEMSPEECKQHDGRGCNLKGDACVAQTPTPPCDQKSEGRCLEQKADVCDWNKSLRVCFNNPLFQPYEKLQAENKKLKEAPPRPETVTVCQLKEKFNADCKARVSKGQTACEKDDNCKWKPGQAANCKQMDDLCKKVSFGLRSVHGARHYGNRAVFLAICQRAGLRFHDPDPARGFQVTPVDGGPAVNIPIMPAAPVAPQVASICRWVAAAGGSCKPRFQEDVCHLYFEKNKNYVPGPGAIGGALLRPELQDICEKGVGSVEGFGDMLLRYQNLNNLGLPGLPGARYDYDPFQRPNTSICQFSPEQSAACVQNVTSNPCAKINQGNSPDDIKKQCAAAPECELKTHKVLVK